MPDSVKQWGDEDYGPYGYGWCNPAYTNQAPVPNEVYLSTIPDDDPWKSPIMEGVCLLDEEFPGWSIRQIKEKFRECRFYARPPLGQPYSDRFAEVLRGIEVACDATSSTHP